MKRNRFHSRPSAGKKIQVPLKELLQHILPQFRKHWIRLVLGFTALLTVDFLQLTIPRLLKKGVDALATDSATASLLIQCTLYIFGIAVTVACLRFVWRYTIIGFSRYLENSIRKRIFAHILKMDRIFFERRTTGDIMAHASNDLTAVQMACGIGMVAAVDASVMSIAAICFMAFIHPTLTVLALLPMPFLAIMTRILSGKLHQRFSTVQEQFSLLTEFSRSTLVSIRLIKAYTMEKFQAGEFDKQGKRYVRANLQVAKIQGLMFPIATLVGNLGLLLILFFGGRLVIRGEISMGDFVAFVTYLYMLVWPMMAIGWVTNLMQRGMTSLGRVHGLLSEQSSLPDPQARESHHLKSQFSLRDLSFTYPGSSQPALSHISLELGPGIHGITGRTGSGKSTLCSLLARLYPVQEGQLFFADTDVNKLALDTVRNTIAYVGQEPVLFSATIAENISLGQPEVEQAKIEAAARQAAIHEDIMGLPQQYETIIGERGVKLSGGQRQRLALARALLIDRSVLLIDDGLSAVDVETENEIFTRLKQQQDARVVIIISNRLKLLSMTDHIIVLDDGVIVDDGSHDHLLAANAFYRTMYDKQMREEKL